MDKVITVALSTGLMLLLSNVAAAECQIICAGPGAQNHSCPDGVVGEETQKLLDALNSQEGVSCYVKDVSDAGSNGSSGVVDSSCVPVGTWYQSQADRIGVPDISQDVQKAKVNRTAAQSEFGVESEKVWQDILRDATYYRDSAAKNKEAWLSVGASLEDMARSHGCNLDSKAYGKISEQYYERLGALGTVVSTCDDLIAEAKERLAGSTGASVIQTLSLQEAAERVASAQTPDELAAARKDFGAVISATSPSDLKVASRHLPRNPSVYVPVAQRLIGTRDFDDYARAARLIKTSSSMIDDPGEKAKVQKMLSPLGAVNFFIGTMYGVSSTGADTWKGGGFGIANMQQQGPLLIEGGLSWVRDRWLYPEGSEYPEIRFSRLQIDGAFLLENPLWTRLGLGVGPYLAAGIGGGKRMTTTDGTGTEETSGGWTAAFGLKLLTRFRIEKSLLFVQAVVHQVRYWGYYDEAKTIPIEDSSGDVTGWRALIAVGFGSISFD